MRISDWSSDVCSSDLGAAKGGLAVLAQRGVDAGDLHAQLRGADGGVVAGGAGADDYDVEVLLFAHFNRSQGMRGIGNEGNGNGRDGEPSPHSIHSFSSGSIPSRLRCGFSSWFLSVSGTGTASWPLDQERRRVGK